MWQYNYSQPSEELMHYGVMGMKWGRRTARTTTASGGKKRVTTSAFTPWTGKTKTVVKEPGKKKSVHVETRSKFLGTKRSSDFKKNSDGSRSYVETTKSGDLYKKSVDVKKADGSRKLIETRNDQFSNTTTVSNISKEQVNAGRQYLASMFLLEAAKAIV